MFSFFLLGRRKHLFAWKGFYAGRKKKGSGTDWTKG